MRVRKGHKKDFTAGAEAAGLETTRKLGLAALVLLARFKRFSSKTAQHIPSRVVTQAVSLAGLHDAVPRLTPPLVGWSSSSEGWIATSRSTEN